MTTLAACQVAPYFKIVVTESGTRGEPPLAPQYLYDPESVDDDKLQFTSDPNQSAVFSLSPTGQLEFTVQDMWGTDVVLLSDQDSHVRFLQSNLSNSH